MLNYTIIIHLGMSGRLLIYNSYSKKNSSKEKEMGVFYHTLVKIRKA